MKVTIKNLAFGCHLFKFLAIITPMVSIWGEEMPSKNNSFNIVQIGDPVLRQKARELSKEEILGPNIQDLIEKMKIIMREAPGVGLAAPQIGIPLQLAVIEDSPEYHRHYSEEELMEKDRYPVPFHVIINPKLFLYENSPKADFFEGCLSVQGLNGIVSRAASVRVECLNEHADPIVIEAHGWYARILQHEIDHLNGILYLDRVQTRTLTTHENFDKYYKALSVKEICETE